MAIDPTISLNAGQPQTQLDPYGGAEKGMNLVNLLQKAQYQPALYESTIRSNTASATGQELMNQQTVRDQSARIRLAEIAKENTKVGPDGTITPDWTAIGNQAASEGYDPATVFSYLQNGNTTIQGQNTANQGKIKTASDQADYAGKVLDATNNLLRVQTDPQRASEIGSGAVHLLNNVLPPELATTYAKQYFNNPPQVTPPPAADANPNDPATAGQQQQHQKDLATLGSHLITQAQVNSRAKAPSTEQGWDDPSSTMSQQAQAQLLQARPDLPAATIGKLTYRQIQADAGLSNSITENIIPGATRAAAIGGPIAAEQQAKVYDNIAGLATKAPSVVSGIPILDIINDKVSPAVRTNADYMAFRSALLDAQKGGSLSSDVLPLTPAAAVTAAQSKASLLRSQGQQTKPLTGPTFSGAAAQAPTGAAPAAPAAANTPPQPGTVQASARDGVLLKVLTGAQARALPPKTRFIGTDGVERITK